MYGNAVVPGITVDEAERRAARHVKHFAHHADAAAGQDELLR